MKKYCSETQIRPRGTKYLEVSKMKTNKMTFKRAIALLVAVCAVTSALMLVGCSKNSDSEAPSGTVNIASDNASYSFYVPTTWKYTKGDTPSAYYSNNDASNVSLMTFSVTHSDYTVDEWWESFTADFESVYEGYELISSEETIFGGSAAVKKIFKGTLGDTEYKFEQVSAMKTETLSAPQVFVFTYTSVPDYFDLHTADVDNIIANFKFN